MTTHMIGVGTALPPVAVPQARAAEMLGELLPEGDRRARSAAALFRRTGVRSRHSVLAEVDGAGKVHQTFFPLRDPLGPGTAARMSAYCELAPGLAAEAARAALADAGPEAGQAASITHLVTVSCTGFGAPGVDRRLIDDLGLSPSVERTNVGFMGCHGALNGLRVARAFVEADPRARVLLVAVELSSLHVQPGGGEGQVVANALFADGAAALVLGSEPAGRAWPVRACGSRLFPASEALMSWQVGDHGFDISLSAQVPDAIEGALMPWFGEWLGESGLRVEDVASWAVHPGGPRIVDSVQSVLGLAADDVEVSREILAELGNMSSPTVLFILKRLMERGARRPCVAMAFGPGLFAEVALFV
ncbi:type III polyketide synthase [Engelhardtia mirabilis]|uniref:Alpha-pyrone synthesis polyketide synthase-like Pks18 n=1 Tax=Engelhardtia mirabilis TaxID=2528011 RepID=A0A518BF69_9BACT|nr:Alpha-pyrone synthesis polyketide synthase-like Pks18 [Planctomycetes bacterium Pla133]QDU99952.1 Alpha-pyrone synthesis polyketide synthase-like Pks18 [Planctomycetes bacterium Pla86]